MNIATSENKKFALSARHPGVRQHVFLKQKIGMMNYVDHPRPYDLGLGNWDHPRSQDGNLEACVQRNQTWEAPEGLGPNPGDHPNPMTQVRKRGKLTTQSRFETLHASFRFWVRSLVKKIK